MSRFLTTATSTASMDLSPAQLLAQLRLSNNDLNQYVEVEALVGKHFEKLAGRRVGGCERVRGVQVELQRKIDKLKKGMRRDLIGKKSK
jgi:hypothetical protein